MFQQWKKARVALAEGQHMKCLAEFDLISEADIVEGQSCLRLTHPKGSFDAFLRRSDVECVPNRCALRLWLLFDSDTLRASLDLWETLLSEALNTLSFASSASFELVKIRRIIDWTPDLVMRDAIYFVQDPATDAPFAILNQQMLTSAQQILLHGDDQLLQRSLRWFRVALSCDDNADRFQCFWFCIEVLAKAFKQNDPVNDACPKCKHPLYCEQCKTHPTHRPYPKQIIQRIITEVCKDDGKMFQRLNDVRNRLAHGDSLASAVPESKVRTELIDSAGKIAWHLIMGAIVRRSEEQQLKLAIAVTNTFTSANMRGAAFISTVFPVDADGLPTDGGVNFQVVRGAPVKRGMPNPPGDPQVTP